MIRALVAHPGTQHSIHLAAELHRLGMLAGLHTGFAFGEGSSFVQLKSSPLYSVFRRLSNRFASSLPPSMIHNQLALELAWQLGGTVGLKGQRQIHLRNQHFQRVLPMSTLVDADVVVGFDTSSWILAERCREIGRPFILDQSIGHPDAWLTVAAGLASQFPDWRANLEPRKSDVRKAEQIEYDKSTLIAAASSFTRETLMRSGIAEDKIRVIPYGVDIDAFTVARPRRDRPFRFLFVGSITPRKGVPLILDAWRKFARPGVELWLVGPLSNQVRALLPDLAGLRILGKKTNAEIPALMRECDVFVFPSYFEGFGLVILEAMATGLPVITTDATAGPDLISDNGQGGWIIPAGDPAALEEAMRYCLARQSDMYAVGQVSRKIAERYTWEAYGRRWQSLLEQILARTRRTADGGALVSAAQSP